MARWKRNKAAAREGFADLEYVPRARCGWDCTLASLAFSARRALGNTEPDLNAWAARHGLPASARYAELGKGALVLWHGTSRERAQKIAQHGLFSKGGLWTVLDPVVSHSYCRMRSETFGTAGAVVCLVIDRRSVIEGVDYMVENHDNGIHRFTHAIAAGLVEYVLLDDRIEFTGERRAARPAPWPIGKFKRADGRWTPLQQPPVRYSPSASYRTPMELAGLCLDRLLGELGRISAIEAFSAVYSAASPWDAVSHDDVMAIIESRCLPAQRRGRWSCLTARACPVAAQ
jgi:hypothetical protein